MEEVYKITGNYRLLVGNSLEKYRCDTFFTKEPETIEWINTFFKDGETFYDIGANVGVYTLYSAHKYPRMQIYGFEPYLKNYERLCDNIQLNGVTNVTPLYMGLSDSTCIEKFFIKDERIGASGNQIYENIDDDGNHFAPLKEYSVMTFSLDRFIKEFSKNYPDHIKVDVDGAEDRIIEGMKQTLHQSTLKSLLIEVNWNKKNAQHIVELIKECGFTDNNQLNRLSNHSRYRRKNTASQMAENIIFIRSRDE